MIDQEEPYERWIAHVRSVMAGLAILKHTLGGDADANEFCAAVNDAFEHGRDMASALEEAKAQYIALLKRKDQTN